LLDVEQDRLRFQLHIHRSADVAAANQFWSEGGIPPPLLRFRRILQLSRARSGTV